MSSQKEVIRRKTVPQIASRKGGEPIVSLTSYHAHTAAIVDKYADFILVGDSLGMVMHGMESTVGVPLDLMIMHGKAVVRGTKSALIVVDMPFGTYEESPNMAFRNASKIMKETQCQAVKLEGGVAMAETIAFLVARGIPVMAHIGLTPQSINTLGGYKVQGRGDARDAALADADAVTAAGAFAVVLEKVPESLADEITARVAIPTIGIGASAGCDGQILVVDDMLGLFTAFKAKFVKRYAHLGDDGAAAIAAYAADVRARAFPGPEHVFADEAPK